MLLVVTLLALLAPRGVPLVTEWIEAWRAVRLANSKGVNFAEMQRAIEAARVASLQSGPDVIIGYRGSPEEWAAYWEELANRRRHAADETPRSRGDE